MGVLEKLERQEALSEAECDIALFVLAHTDEVTHMSISDLARRTFTSNATIIRLCKKLGLAGYRDFRIEVSADVERRRSDVRTVDVNLPFGVEANLPDIMSSLATLEREAIEGCYASVARAEIRRAALAIHRAGRTFVFGQGDSRISALAFANQLLKLGVNCVDGDRFDESLAHAVMAEAGDAVVVVSYSGHLMDRMARQLALFRARRARVILVSASEDADGADVHIRFPARESAESNIATFYSQECIRYLLNCVYAQLFAFDYDRNMALKGEVDLLTSGHAG